MRKGFTREWKPAGWFILLTIRRHDFGVGFAGHAPRWNGFDFYFGPITLTVQPPAPKWLAQPHD